MAKSKTRKAADAAASRLSTPTPRVPAIPPEDFLSTGCTLLNLAFTGHPDRGVPKGTYLYVVGASGAMKTWSAFTLLAEAARNPHFRGYRFVHDNAENGALMDVEKYFGAGVLDRLEPPRVESGAPAFSRTAQEFYYNLDIACRKSCVYILDSMDALDDEADDAKFAAEVKHHETGEGEIPGSMGMAKAKTNSKNIGRVVQNLRKNGSILVVISQTRDKVGSHIPGLQTRAGGRALKFYAHLEAWTTVTGVLKRTYLGREREYGSTIKIDVQKNRVSGWEGQVFVDFIKGHGIDDSGTLVDYLVEECHWPETKGTITAPEFDFEGKKETLVRQIESSEAGVEKLKDVVAAVWREIIAGASPLRKPRYT